MMPESTDTPPPAALHTATVGRHVLLLGATGTIGRATLQVLLRAGYQVTCALRASSATSMALPSGATCRTVDLTDASSIAQQLFAGASYDAVVSCLASRTGAPRDAWAIDHAAHQLVLNAAKAAGVRQFVLLSAICVQKPQLAFQQAKRAFEDELMASGLIWSIVRPTAYFKSLSGQVRRVQKGKPFLLFGDGTLTACKPISDNDLGRYLASCLTDPTRQQRILSIGGPGPAITLRQQGELLFRLADMPPHFTSVPVRFFDVVISTLGALARLWPPLAAKAEFARIGRYYATESMLVWDAARQCYDADATPSFGEETLADHYTQMLRGDVADDRGAHAVF